MTGFKVSMTLQAAFDAFIAAGLCTKATLQVDDAPISVLVRFSILALSSLARLEIAEVLVDIWGTGGSLELVLPVLVEGHPQRCKMFKDLQEH